MLAALAATSVSGLLYAVCFPPFGLAGLGWVVLVPWLLAVRGRGPLAAAALSALWACFATWAVIAWVAPTLAGHFQWSALASVGFLLGFSLLVAAPFYAIAFAAWSLAQRGLPPVALPWLAAVAFVAAEVSRSYLGFGSPWAKLGDAHFDSPRLRQLAELAGVFGIGGLVALANAAFAELLHWAWHRRRGPAAFASAGTAVAGCALLIAGALGFGQTRMAAAQTAGPMLDVAIVQGNVAAELRWRRSTAGRVIRRYGGLTRDLLLESTPSPPDLIVWPENAIQTPLDDPVYGIVIEGLTRGGVPLLIGAPHAERTGGVTRHHNSAFLLREGRPPLRYDKRRLLPFSETPALGTAPLIGRGGDLDAGTYTPGERPGLFHLGGHTLGVLICFEAVHPDMARDLVRNGAELLVVLSNDGWYRGRGGAAQHLAHVVFRAVELRVPVVRATTTGISAVIAPDGSIVARLGEGEAGVLRARVQAGSPPTTLSHATGDALAWGCAALTGLAPLAAVRRIRRSAPASRPGRAAAGWAGR